MEKRPVKSAGSVLAIVGGGTLAVGALWIALNILLEVIDWSIAPSNETALIVYNVFSCGIPLLGLLLLLVGVVLRAAGRGRAHARQEPASPAATGGSAACPACGAENPPDYAFCDRCGAKLYEEIV